ncbi:MAG: alpha/beta hydrolase [Bacteroidetes bacterium SW_9_63_38]|nr:MAG: alpha/beta hydrolase [Bacteroidetes bacterium SW_9_63_38]
MRSFPLLFSISLVLVGCSSITIGEEEVFYPKSSVTPETFDGEGVTLRNQFLPVTDSVEVNAWHLTQPEAEATVLFFGGNGFYLVQSRGYLHTLTRPPANAVLWDYRGYGRSEGEPGVEAFRHDALELYDHLVEEEGVDPQRLVVWGHSLGSFLATHVAQERSVAGVVLENPATNVDGWVDHLIPWYVRLFLGVDVAPALRTADNVARVQSLEAPLVVVAGEEDNVTDPAMAKRLHQEAGSAQKTLVTVPDGGHNELYEHEDVQAAYADLVTRIAADPDSTAARVEGR